MEETIESLEAQRKALYQKLEELGDFRRGALSVNYRKSGKKNCVCAKP
jgi:dsDNA-specific endonuclease/ATPase MutS2